jgi:hypothetical protein
MIGRVLVRSTGYPGAPGLNAFYFQDPGALNLTQAQANDALARVRAFFAAVAANFATVQGFLVDPIVVTLDELTGVVLGSLGTVVPALVSGTTAVSVGPPQVQLLLKQSTAAVALGRRVQGRSYIGPLQQNVTVGVAPNGVTAGGISSAAIAQLTPGAPVSTVRPCVWHRPQKPSTKHPTGVVGGAFAVTGYSCPLFFATQRRRNQ